MTDKLKKTIEEELGKLPKDRRRAINLIDWVNIVKEIGEQNTLLEEEIHNLQVETLLVLIGVQSVNLYQENIENEVILIKNGAEKIAEEVTEKIFKPIAEKIREQQPELGSQDDAPLTNTLDERFDSLPEEVRQIITKANYHTKLFAIASRHNFTVPQMGTLEETTTRVMTGTLHADEFEKMLVKNLGLPEGVVRGVAGEVNEQILRPIREQIEKVYGRPTNGTDEIFSKAGIKIIRPEKEVTSNTKPVINAMELKEGNPEIDKKMKSVLEQKLNGPVQVKTTTTNHSLTNMRPSSAPSETKERKVDPYREIPE